MKVFSTVLEIKEKQIKITMRYFTPISLVKIKKSDIIKGWQGEKNVNVMEYIYIF